jgi:hypothetical protein
VCSVHSQPASAESGSAVSCESCSATMDRPAQAPTQLPPGFRFHPTDEELVVLYLRRKALARPLPAAVIPVVHDVARLDPWDVPGACCVLY